MAFAKIQKQFNIANQVSVGGGKCNNFSTLSENELDSR